MKSWGIFIVIAGIVLILFAYGAPSAPEFARTVNYEMMQMKTLHAIAGAGCLVAGAIWSAAGELIERLASAEQSHTAADNAATSPSSPSAPED